MTESVKKGSDTRSGVVGPRGEYRQLALLSRFLASRHRCVEERHVWTLGINHRRDTFNSGYTDRAHLHPDGARRKGSKHALVTRDRDDGIGVGHHRDNDGGSPRRVANSVRDLRSQIGQVPGRLPPAVPDNRRDASAQSTGRHPMAHRSDPEHCNRLVRFYQSGLPLAACL
jgi:hypothetical protein